MTALVDAHDVVLFDLDGVVYLGPQPVPGAAEGIARLRQRGVRLGFVTNNAARRPEDVAAHLQELGIECAAGDVTTSGQAGARLLAERLPAGAAVLVLGTDALRSEVLARGLTEVDSADDAPAGVIQGYDPQLRWPRLNEAAHAVQRGAVWVATNTDSNRPTERGLVPGHGTAVAAVRAAVTVDPLVAGKPATPLLLEAVQRTGGQRPVFVGDRLDTDVAGARAAGLASVLVLSGSHGKADLLAAVPGQRPDHVARDLRGLLEPALTSTSTDAGAVAEGVEVRLVDGALSVDDGLDPRQQLAAVWAASRLSWAAADEGRTLDATAVLAATPDVP
ncbi:HAD-IIA family hydrolase [Auraticoccus monumenti]|uniref:Haloacid Dehalogenase Superfamily Class (Subfamily) IIA n=1 Tax=Auraticoccus monumenti TaxID=675864 RepID=A0A1G7CW94_9ACTN|nr:HAD-IIA family hydrolase [Auraticoccus monumenti]SDE43521.1 Haloacid Dehalogenase Superfamily Class (subfamily) IIA [Auraticoccus monumenti]